MTPGQRVTLWLLFSAACLAIAWLWPRLGLWWRLREAAALWRAREDMEAALWAECTAEAAKGKPLTLETVSTNPQTYPHVIRPSQQGSAAGVGK